MSNYLSGISGRQEEGRVGRHSGLWEQNVQIQGVEKWSVEFMELEVCTVGKMNVLDEQQE